MFRLQMEMCAVTWLYPFTFYFLGFSCVLPFSQGKSRMTLIRLYYKLMVGWSLWSNMCLWNSPFSVEFKVCITISFKSNLAKAQPKSDPTAPRLWVRKNPTFFSGFFFTYVWFGSYGKRFLWNFSDGTREITAGTCPNKARSVQLLTNKLTYHVKTCFFVCHTQNQNVHPHVSVGIGVVLLSS